MKQNLKVHICTSITCCNIDCDYCHKCSHAFYLGCGTDINGKKWKWEFNPYSGPSFFGPELECQPDEKSPVWELFEMWHYRFTRECSNRNKPVHKILKKWSAGNENL